MEIIAQIFMVFSLLFQTSLAVLDPLSELLPIPSNTVNDNCPAWNSTPPNVTFNNSDAELFVAELLDYLLTISDTDAGPDSFKETCPIVESYGYPCENHTVTTEDGYILTMHRIPGKRNAGYAGGQPCIIQHGLFSECTHFFYLGLDSFPFLLADSGYDVWMGNFRGNAYSRNHTTLNINNPKFWDFSWHELGIYDNPAMIDYVLKITGYCNLFYVGHSMGTTAGMVMLSEKPEYNQKVAVMTMFAPVASCTYMRTPVRVLSPMLGFPGLDVKLPFFPHEIFKYVETLWARFCTATELGKAVCQGIIFLLMGFDSSQIEKARMGKIMSRMPSSTSTRCMNHYFQLMNCLQAPCFHQYDWGVGNPQKYGKLTPPSYNLKNVKCPTLLYYGKNDWLAAPGDVLWVAGQLPNVLLNGPQCVNCSQWNHIDFIWARDAPTLLYRPCINTLAGFQLLKAPCSK